MQDDKISNDVQKIPCDGCRKMIPEGMAFTSKGRDKLFYFCDLSCFEEWKSLANNPIGALYSDYYLREATRSPTTSI